MHLTSNRSVLVLADTGCSTVLVRDTKTWWRISWMFHLEEKDEENTGSHRDPDHPPPAQRRHHFHSQEDDKHGAQHPEDLMNSPTNSILGDLVRS